MEAGRQYAMHFVLFFDAMAKALALTSSDMKCLTLLHCYGPMTPGKLASCADLTTGGVTKVLDRLESRNFIRRESAAGDRRKQMIFTTPPTAVHRNKQNQIDIHSKLAALADAYTEAEFAVVVDFMQRGTEVLKGMTTQLREQSEIKKGGNV